MRCAVRKTKHSDNPGVRSWDGRRGTTLGGMPGILSLSLMDNTDLTVTSMMIVYVNQRCVVKAFVTSVCRRESEKLYLCFWVHEA